MVKSASVYSKIIIMRVLSELEIELETITKLEKVTINSNDT